MQTPPITQPAFRYLRQVSGNFQPSRTFTTALRYHDGALQSEASPQARPPRILDPNLVSTRKEELALLKQGKVPIGSRRRRAALKTSQNLPFEQLPYQCFQEARKVLQADREDKLEQIATERRRIASVESRDAASMGGERVKTDKLRRMRKYLEELKILADINDPVIKKRFEDGEGDMSRPIYRHLALQKWRSYKRLLLLQRLSQMFIVPDLLPHLDLTTDISISFGRYTIQPGAFVSSLLSERPAKLAIQVFDKGPHLVTIAVVDADVPDPENDAFDTRCHFLATNVLIDPSTPHLPLARLDAKEQVVFPWMPPHAQKGSPYHRLAIVVLQQPEGKILDVGTLREGEKRLGFSLRRFMAKTRVQAVGATLFRTVWDEGTAAVMGRVGLEGADVEFRRKKPEALPYKKKDGERYR